MIHFWFFSEEEQNPKHQEEVVSVITLQALDEQRVSTALRTLNPPLTQLNSQLIYILTIHSQFLSH